MCNELINHENGWTLTPTASQQHIMMQFYLKSKIYVRPEQYVKSNIDI